SQLIAMPVIPRIAAMALATAREHFHHKERCLFCDLIDQELDDGRRIVARNDHFLCYIPYASRFPFEMVVLPLAHHHDFSEMEDGLALALAQILSESIRRLAALFGDLPFNLTIHTAPNTGQSPRRSGYWSTLGYDWHWQVEILPRLHPVHGFEWGTGLFINPTPAEEAARYLREAKI
ncbi:MAG TPA: galactose-1-phosphate uridylyltransferase, partial [Candidatus Glassbacteria bacterium]|nr:galactose-1-phosphate uridylyltransferase [Candidatus Glassbacteria bacterium]